MSRLGMPGSQAGAHGNRCLGDQLTAYADRAMPDAVLLHWDRHLVACISCRAAVEEERRVLAALRSPSASCVPGDLRSMLLAVAAEVCAEAQPSGRAGARTPGRSAAGPSARQSRDPFVPPVPVAPVPVVDRTMPAFHRSARRATVFAGIAAGATAAAAWGLAVTGSNLNPPVRPTSPAVQGVRPVTPGYANASFTVRGLGTRGAPVPTTTSPVGPAVSQTRDRSAQSTP
jgi:hypothetical protein